MSLGQFGNIQNMPPILGGQEIRWDFDTPLKAASEQAKAAAFQSTTDVLAKAMQIDPDVSMNVDLDEGTRDAIIGVGGADWLLDEKIVAQKKAQAAQAQQAAQAANAMGHMADTGTKVATAVKSAGEAGKTLQQSGMMQ